MSVEHTPITRLPDDKKHCSGVRCLVESYNTDGKVDIDTLKKVTSRLAWLCHICKALWPCLKNSYATGVAADRLRIQYSYTSRFPLDNFLMLA